MKVDDDQTSKNVTDKKESLILAKQGNLINLEEALSINRETESENKQFMVRHK